jgi:hypothetical protein
MNSTSSSDIVNDQATAKQMHFAAECVAVLFLSEIHTILGHILHARQGILSQSIKSSKTAPGT